MNKVIMTGRATKDPELKYTAGKGTAVGSFGLAVPDKYNKEKVDFFNVVAFGPQGEYVAKYLGKGKRVLVEGRLSTRHYPSKDGKEVYITELIAENIEIMDWLNDSEKRADTAPEGKDFEDMTPVDDSDIPF